MPSPVQARARAELFLRQFANLFIRISNNVFYSPLREYAFLNQIVRKCFERDLRAAS